MELVEIQFKGQRKELYVNSRELYLHTGNYCVVQADRGEDMGLIVSIAKVGQKETESDLKEILRHATDHDVEAMGEKREKELEALKTCQQKASEHDLQIKLVDVEFQFDGNKITFYFTADGRIDFRELVKDLAGVFRTRIDLRQIGVRDEARRFDGMGMCGRKLCCSSWLKDFEPVTLKMAKDQNLPLTPSKISGACGRLMCCLAYELADYKELVRDIPKVGSKVNCFGGRHRLEKVDIFRASAILSDDDGNTIEVTIEDLKSELEKSVENAPDARSGETGDKPAGPEKKENTAREPGANNDNRQKSDGGRGRRPPRRRNRKN
ncbi:MAG: stage 0 sporulation protein [Candidatus Krumholzibacteria bacterium]|nr:stage 0 sporulation protein [Candidatus Krumholzibacteria bacterium]